MAFEIREFTCPECGSHEFEQNEASGLLCHGYTAKGHCNFRCGADDPRYFKGTGRFIPTSVMATATVKG